MRIKELTLWTNKMEEQRYFYEEKLAFNNLKEERDGFSLQVGFTKLRFKKSKINLKYHYCFLIPSNQLMAGIAWLEERLDLVRIEQDRIIQRFESWNADSIYFYDGAGNLAEFIVRYDLKNENDYPFSSSSIIGVNEIGLPTTDIEKTNQLLEQKLGSAFWKGDKKRFGTHGTNEGLLLLPNYEVKRTWFPTQMKIETAPFEGVIEIGQEHYYLFFEREKLHITP